MKRLKFEEFFFLYFKGSIGNTGSLTKLLVILFLDTSFLLQTTKMQILWKQDRHHVISAGNISNVVH